MDYKNEIVKEINRMSGAKSPYEIFCDWVKCMALSIQNIYTLRTADIWKAREEEYIRTIKPYGREGGMVFAKMAAWLSLCLEADLTDALGEIYMMSEMGNKNTGQFFTPFHVSYMCAQMSLINEDGSRTIHMNEPSCGGGGMVIAAAKVLKDRGINYQRCLKVVAQDLDWKAVYMCYVQLSLLGIDAEVVQGDTLSEPYINQYPKNRTFHTPAKMGVLL